MGGLSRYDGKRFDYTFEVLAVDRDLVYSQIPATVTLSVTPDLRDQQIEKLQTEVKLIPRP